MGGVNNTRSELQYSEMNNKKIAVIGQGFVGGSLTQVFSERGTTVYAYDKTGKLAPGGKVSPSGVKPGDIDSFITDCERDPEFSGVFFVCVPTPMRRDGSADLRIVESVLSDLARVSGRERIAVVKSTVPPGSTQAWNDRFSESGLHVVFSPEFLTEANALEDMRNQDRIVLGGPRPYINTVKAVFEAAFPQVPIIKTSSTTAEMVKYVTNCFLATKVSFANEMYQICQALDAQGKDIDYDKVIEYATKDKRLGTSHWKVPGPDSFRGFGSHCFPKDLCALSVMGKSLNVCTTVLDGVWTKNLEVRKNRDWEQMTGRAVSEDE